MNLTTKSLWKVTGSQSNTNDRGLFDTGLSRFGVRIADRSFAGGANHNLNLWPSIQVALAAHRVGGISSPVSRGVAPG